MDSTERVDAKPSTTSESNLKGDESMAAFEVCDITTTKCESGDWKEVRGRKHAKDVGKGDDRTMYVAGKNLEEGEGGKLIESDGKGGNLIKEVISKGGGNADNDDDNKNNESALSKGVEEKSFGYYSDLSDEDECGGDLVDESSQYAATKKTKRDIGREKAREQKLKNNEWFESVSKKHQPKAPASHNSMAANTTKPVSVGDDVSESGEDGKLAGVEEANIDVYGKGADGKEQGSVDSNELHDGKMKEGVGIEIEHQRGSVVRNVLSTAKQLIKDFLVKDTNKSSSCGNKVVIVLNIDTAGGSNTLLNFIKSQPCNMCVQVDLKSNELMGGGRNRTICGELNEDTLVVCQVPACGNQDGIAGLGKFLSEFVGTAGLVFICQNENSDAVKCAVSTADFVVELASSGLIPSSSSPSRTLLSTNYFDSTSREFVAYFQKQPYSIRNPTLNDVDELLAIDGESWKPELRYPRDIIEAWVANTPQDIIVMVGRETGKAVGAMYTRSVRNGEIIDAIPWRESIVLAADAGTDGKIDPNIDTEHGMVLQLLRVSTKHGGRSMGSSMQLNVPGKTLRDFALVISASHGINQVVSND